MNKQIRALFIGLLLCWNTVVIGFDHKHQKLTDVLIKFTKQEGYQSLVNYKKLKNEPQKLRSYLKSLEEVSKKQFKSFSKNQQLAFWINAYNAYTLDVIIKAYPVKSIKEIGGNFIFKGPWRDKFITLLGKKRSLDNIEHDIIRKDFHEPRIHFAVNCASIGCPSLLREAFVADKLEDQFEKAAKNFMNNPKKNYVKGNSLYLSKIFKWYGDDFDEKYGGYKKYALKYHSQYTKDDFEWSDYDWSLNEFK